MTISRRGFIAAAAITSATIALPAWAAPIPAPPFAVAPPPGMFVPDVMGHRILRIMRVAPRSPLLSDPAPLTPFEIASYYTGKGCRPRPPFDVPNFTIGVEPFRPEELQEFDSVRDLLVASMNERLVPAEYRLDLQIGKTPRVSCVGDLMVDARIQLNRQANLVAARTRRGAAQTVLYGGPNNAWGFAIDDLPTMWPRAQFYETSALNPDEIAVIWHTQIDRVIDGPFVAQMLPGGRVRAVVREDSKNYGIIVKAID